MRAAALTLLASAWLWSAETVEIAGVTSRLSPSAEESANSAGRRRKGYEETTRRRQFSGRDGSVKGLNCITMVSGPGSGVLEMMKDCDESGTFCQYAIFTVDTSTGKTAKLWDVPVDSSTGQVVPSLDACALHPLDNVIYCISSLCLSPSLCLSYIVRFDETKLHFVASIGKQSTSAAFGADGTFYYEGSGNSGVYKVPDLKELYGYGSDDSELKDHSDDSAIADSMSGAGDLIWTNNDLGEGPGKEYLITMNSNWEVIVACVSSGCSGQMWTISAAGASSGVTPTTFGAGWSLGKRFFFADDGGAGLFEVSYVNLGEKKAWVSRVADAGIASGGETDGLSCSDAAAPELVATTTTEEPTTTTKSVRRRRRRSRRRATTTTAAPSTTTAAPEEEKTPKGQCPAGFNKKESCGCDKDVVRCQKM